MSHGTCSLDQQLKKQRQQDRNSVSSNSTHGSTTATELTDIDIDEEILNEFLDDESGLDVCIPKFLQFLQNAGIRPLHDKRFDAIIKNLKKVGTLEGSSQLPEQVDLEEFKRCIKPNIAFMNKIFANSLIIPDWMAFTKEVGQIYDEVWDCTEGTVYQKNKSLAKVDNSTYDVSICTVDGQILSLGPQKRNTQLCDCALPLLYSIAITELGTEKVHACLGKEPEPQQEDHFCLKDGKPFNPLTEAGGVVVTDLLSRNQDVSECFERLDNKVYEQIKSFTGSESVGFSNSFSLNMMANNNILYGIGHYLKEEKALPQDYTKRDLERTLKMYMDINAIHMSTSAGAVVAATFAGAGMNPFSYKKIASTDAVRQTLSMMVSCGMNSYSGAFAFEVGLPAKSNISGMTMVVVPGAMGICISSPALDSDLNSVRGVEFCKRFTDRFRFHQFEGIKCKRSDNKIDPRRIGSGETKDQQKMAMFFAAYEGNMTMMYRYHKENVNFEDADYDGRTALHLAVCGDRAEVVQFLIKICHVGVNPIDRTGATPLDDANKLKKTNIKKFLKKYGALSASEFPEDQRSGIYY